MKTARRRVDEHALLVSCGFAAAWPTRTGEFADRLNALPKYVVSTTLASPAWSNSHVIGADLADEIGRLKDRPGPDILAHGSRTLVQALMKGDLVDAYHLIVFPIVLGNGMRLFQEGDAAKLALIEAKAFTSGAVLLRYEPARG